MSDDCRKCKLVLDFTWSGIFITTRTPVFSILTISWQQRSRLYRDVTLFSGALVGRSPTHRIKQEKGTTGGQTEVMRELQGKAAATPLSAPRRKMLRARFWALILLRAGTDFHYKDIIGIAARPLKQKISKHPPRPFLQEHSEKRQQLWGFNGGSCRRKHEEISVSSSFGGFQQD